MNTKADEQKRLNNIEFICAKKKIYLFKYHLIRSWTQDNIKYQILNTLDTDSVYLHFDWAMKYLPVKFRESQEDWFGKRGISWHLSCAVFYENNELVNLTFVHAFENTSQDSNSVTGILKSVFEILNRKIG